MNDTLNPGASEALQAWAARVRANRDQAERVREGEPPRDFYAPISAMFRADPHRTDEPALNALKALIADSESVLDIGAGGGRLALPLALSAREVVAIEPSDAMLAVLREGMAEHGIANVRILQSTWPMADAPEADISLISHIGYDIEAIGPFIDAMEASARRLCMAVLVAGSPPYLAEPFWPPVHGEERARLPGLAEFMALLLARGRLFEVRLFERPPVTYGEARDPLIWLYQQLFISPESEKGALLARLAQERLTERDGRYALSWEPQPLGLVTWRPGKG